MSIIAKLYIEDKVFNILKFNFSFNQKASLSGFPSSRPTGGRFNIVIESVKDSLFIDWILSENSLKNAKIEISQTYQVGRTRKIELLDIYCLQHRENFDGVNSQPMVTFINLSPAIMLQDGIKIFEWYWKVTDLSSNAIATVIDNEPEIVNHHIEDLEGSKLDKDEIDVGEEIVLVIESSNAVGETLEIDLDDQKLDYEHNGVKLKDDALELQINDDIERIPLKAVLQED